MKIEVYTIFLAILFIYMFVISYSNLKKGRKSALIFGIICFAILAFFFDPVKAWEKNGNYTDLYRFFFDMEKFSNYGWNCPIQYLKTDYSAILISKILVYGISKIGYFGLLSSVSLLIVYGVSFYIFFDYSKTKNMNPYLASSAFFIFICLYNYVTIITNIRMPIATALYFFILYNDLIKKKNFKWCLLGYFLLILIHTSFILFFVIRLSVIFVTRRNWKLFSLLFLTYGLFISILGNIVEIFSSNIFVKAILQKMYLYFYTDKAKEFDISIIFLRNTKNYYNDINFKNI